jgi:predicted RNA-binding Zn-ribbon protein involved in translation (DUF1610 family)
MIQEDKDTSELKKVKDKRREIGFALFDSTEAKAHCPSCRRQLVSIEDGKAYMCPECGKITIAEEVRYDAAKIKARHSGSGNKPTIFTLDARDKKKTTTPSDLEGSALDGAVEWISDETYNVDGSFS